MKTKQKGLLLALCAVLLVAVSVFGTLAYLTDTESVQNTFTVGKVSLVLDEADVNGAGQQLNKDGEVWKDGEEKADRVQANEYRLLPGHTYIKDPTVTVDANSEDAYVRMMVEVVNIDRLKEALPAAEYYGENDVFLLQNLCVNENGELTWDPSVWKFEGYTEADNESDNESSNGKTGTYEFRYVGNDAENSGNGIVVKSENPTKLPALFQSITVPSEIDNDHLAKLADVKINVTAHAIQADGFAGVYENADKDADAAWKAFN